MVHPKTVRYNTKAIDYIYKYHYGIGIHKFFGLERNNKNGYQEKRFNIFTLPIIKIKKYSDRKKVYFFGIRLG